MNEGDKIKVNCKNLDLYPSKPPANGTEGIILKKTIHFGLKDMFGIELPMYIVQFDLDAKETFSFYEEDITKI